MDGVEGESRLHDVAVQMVQAMKEMPAAAAAKWAGIVVTLCAGRSPAPIFSAGGGGSKPAMTALP
jgi:hypothetical protein